MSRSVSQKRPWLAALLGLFATGLGHLYLRRWRRAFGWLLLLFGTGTLFVDPATLEAAAAGNADVVALAPILAVGLGSVIDAYLLAYAQNALSRRVADPAERTPTCPHCGKERDTDLDFCQWCTAEIPEAQSQS